jgi:Uma2 family endonuclease
VSAKPVTTARRTRDGSAVLGPFDHGRPMTLAAFDRVECRGGWRAELIEGTVHMSPAPESPHDYVNKWLYDRLNEYYKASPAVLNYVSFRPRVFVPGRRKSTCPEPDVAAFDDYPYHLPLARRTWKAVSPLLVAEVLSEDVDKDLKRNVVLYAKIPSIQEYWVVDPLAGDDDTFFRVFRRHGSGWHKPVNLRFAETYTTKLLPGFRLVLDYDA